MIKREFNFSDDLLIQYASDQYGFLAEDLPEFTAFDASLNEAHRDEFKVLIDWALAEGGDEINVSKLGDFTEKLHEEIKKARKLYAQLRYWVVKTFPKRKAVQRQFGIGRFTKLADSQERLIKFFAGLTESVADYRVQLEAAGTPTSLMDSIAVQSQELTKAQNDQEKKKGNRGVDTEIRTSKLNELFAYTRQYNNAAEFVFFDSPAMRDRYRPPSNANAADDLPEDGE